MHVMTSAAEAEMTGLFFYNCQTANHLQCMLQALGHPQHSTVVKTDIDNAA